MEFSPKPSIIFFSDVRFLIFSVLFIIFKCKTARPNGRLLDFHTGNGPLVTDMDAIFVAIAAESLSGTKGER